MKRKELETQSGFELHEYKELLHRLRNQIKDFCHIEDVINPKLLATINKDIDAIDVEIEARMFPSD